MKAKNVKRQVQFNRVKRTNEPIVINRQPSKKIRPIKRGGCCLKKRT